MNERLALRLRSARPRMSPSLRRRALGRRELRIPVLRRVPTAAWICALVAFLNASAWSIIVPPFQGKDEVDHFAYVALLAETGKLPEKDVGSNEYSPEEARVMEGLGYYRVRFSPHNSSISTVEEQRALEEDVNAGESRLGTGHAGTASSEPPLYYALQVVPYLLGSGNMLNQIQLMRFVSVLFGAMTALFVALFLREALPGVPWAATVGGLCVALEPLLAFMSGSVTPDALLYTISAALFYALARGFRRGLTLRLAGTIGVLSVMGFLTKLNFVGIAGGVLVGLAVLVVRELRSRRYSAGRPLAIALCIGVPVALAIVVALAGTPALEVIEGTSTVAAHNSLFNEISYIWQLYLPRLPGMAHYFNGMTTFRDIWFDRSVGLYGWMDTMFPEWVNNLAVIPAVVVALLCGRELVAQRRALRARWTELAVYALIAVGVLLMVGVVSYASDVLNRELALGEPRYLLPMLPLLGAVFVLAVRGVGRRWASVAGAALVVLLLGYDLFSQLQVIARYYG